MADTYLRQVFGFMGAPGTGKTAAMNVVEAPENLQEIAARLGKDSLTVDVAKKATSRENRGADDRFKISGMPRENFENNPEMIGRYILTNNGAYYAYPKSEFEKDADILVAEPSIHHLDAVKAHLGDRLVTIMLVASRAYREARMTERGTEEMSQVLKRLVEGDAQTWLVNKLGGGNLVKVEELIDADLNAIFNRMYEAKDDAAAVTALQQEFTDWLANHVMGGAEADDATKKFAADAAKEYTHLVTSLTPVSGKIVEMMMVLDDSYLSSNFIKEGKFREEILNTVETYLKQRLNA